MIETEKVLVMEARLLHGTNLVEELRKNGQEVISLDLFNTDMEEYVYTAHASSSGKAKVHSPVVLR